MIADAIRTGDYKARLKGRARVEVLQADVVIKNSIWVRTHEFQIPNSKFFVEYRPLRPHGPHRFCPLLGTVSLGVDYGIAAPGGFGRPAETGRFAWCARRSMAASPSSAALAYSDGNGSSVAPRPQPPARHRRHEVTVSVVSSFPSAGLGTGNRTVESR
jgi:hypothetical protein